MKKLLSLFTALLLFTAMWGASKVSQTLYKVEGALYQGLNENFTGGTNVFVPNDSAAVFTSFDGQPADWYRSNSLQEGGKGTPSFTFQKGFGDYAPMQIRNYTGYGINATKTKIDYIYGKAAYNGKTLVVGASGMNMMSMANGYYFRTEDSASTGDIGKCYADNKTANTYKSNSSYGTYMMYGNDFTHSTHGAVQAYEMVLDNPGEMYIDYVVLPIFGYPKDETATIEKMIPEGKKVTLKLYPLSAISKNADGKYSYTKESTPIATMTADASAYTQDATKGYSYRGTLKFELDEPILMTKSFVARLTWDDGCNFGLITDYYNLQNYTTWYIFKDGKYFMWEKGGYNASISYHAMFPTLESKDESTELTIPSTGIAVKTEKEISFRSNINPTFDGFTIEVSDDSWINMNIEKKNITYSGTTYKQSGTNYITFDVTAEPNTTGKTREATITLKHHGKELKYTVSQESMPSAFYNVPANAFFAGMTETGDTAAECKTFYLPYNYGQEYTFTSTEAGDWTSSEEGTPDETNKNYSYSNRTMKDSCHTPLLAVDGKVGYQYGASGESYDENLYFHIGDSVMHYMTPARLYGEYGKPTYYLSANYKTTEYDTVGVYFNNEDVMYIDGISIPIKNSKATGVSDMFPTDDAHVIVNIYKATSAGGKSENKVDRNTRFYTDTLTKGDFKVHPDEPNRGTLNKTFEKPISGPFVVELSDMKHSGCSFTIYSSTEREGENMWGYFYNKGSRTFPGNYTPLISVHAMFPVLYGKSGEDLTIDTIPVTGSTFGDKDCPTRTIYANVKYNKLDEDGWSRKHEVTGVIMRFYNNDRTEKSTKWYFEMSPNTSGAVREGDIIFNLRGKKLAYHVTQAAPTLTPREGMEQYFEMLLQDDTVHNSNGDKVTKVYLESEVSLEDTIKVISKKGLTKIDKTFGNKDGKYYVCLTFTRAKYVPTDTEDIITVSFEKNANNKYEYTILHKGAGKLRPDTTSRTFVVGPKGGNALFLNDDNTVGDRYVRLYCDVPASNTKASYYKEEHFCTLSHSSYIDTEGRYYKRVSASVDSETTEERLDSFRVYLPGCDTIKFYVRQETTPRVWQHAADRLTTLEVGNQGGLAHFKGYKNTEMILVSNIPIEENEVNVTCADWITATPVINANKDTVRITFTVDEYIGKEARTDSMKITVQGNEFILPLTQKVFSIEWAISGGGSELVIPVEGGKTTFLNILGTEPYREGLLQITIPDGVSITDRKTETISTGQQRTICKFKKDGFVTEDWQDTIFLALDTINQEAGFEYHFKDTIIITQAAPEPAPTYIREGSVDNYGTLCFPYTPTQDVTGADFYKVLWFNEAEMDLVLEKITGQPEAAVPYIFQYTDTKMVWAYDPETPVEISATGVNGLHGVASEEGYTVSESDATVGTYLLSNNQIVKAAVESHAAQYRAYLKLNEVSKDAPVGPATAPRIHMVVPGNGAPTNLNGLNGNVKATKVLRDGQLIIIRDGKTYNAQGIEL